MLSFKTFLKEQEDPEEGASRQIKHLTHVEDRPLQNGEKGAQHAIKSLSAAAEHIKTGKKTSEMTTKYDGSPAIVYGHHPETGKFFVASKSAFNKTPKINYTPKDIEKNHGHAPGLVKKLKDALTYLPKVAPKEGVYQGDMMFSKEDKHKSKSGGTSFHPNPSGLTYTAHGTHKAEVDKAKIGVVTHLKYEGKNAASLNASHKVDHENFGKHSDVFSVDPRMDTSKVHFSPEQQKQFNKHIAAAQKIHDTHGDDMYAGTKTHQGVGGDLETYMNHTVRTGEETNHQNFKNWLETKKNKEIDKLKVEKNRTAKQTELKGELDKIERNKKHYNNLFKMHGELQKAKNTLINVMNQHQEFQHEHGGEAANPEGYVFHHGKESDKLVNRQEFSRRNFAGIRNI
jgi:Family of unknown function (DUF6267)